jgi:hypothetical protein
VFDYLLNLKWRDVALMDVYDVKQTKDGVGTHFTWAFKVAGLRIEGFDVFTDVVTNKSITERSAGVMPMTSIDSVEKEGTGTRLTTEVHPEGLWRLPLLNRVLEFGMARMGDRMMPRFKKDIEETAKKQREATPTRPRKTAASH